MTIAKKLSIMLALIIAVGLFDQLAMARIQDNQRPRRVRATGNANATDDANALDSDLDGNPDEVADNEQRTGVVIKRRRKHGVIHRAAVATGKGTATGTTAVVKGTGKGATVVAEGTADGARYGAGKTAKGATAVGKGTGRGAKTVAKGTKSAGKAVVDAFK